MRFDLGFVFCLITISVGVLIMCAEEISGTNIIILKSADDTPNLSPDQGSKDSNSTQRVYNSERGGLCSTAQKSRHRRHHKGHKGCACRRILCPVCATDSLTYANLCYFNCQKLKHSDLEVVYNGRCNITAQSTS